MTEQDDKLSARYRELAREKPPPALDAAILAASRRALARPSFARRWGAPVSIAAVLMLAIGVTLHMQREQPGVETSELPPAPAARARPIAPPPPSARPQSVQSAPAPRPSVEPKATGAPQGRRLEAPARALAPAAPAVSATAAASPKPERAQGFTAAQGAAQEQNLSVLRARRPAADSASEQKAAPEAQQRIAADPAAELERIARLRAGQHDEEADKALEEFRRRFPDYRIPAAVWERVRPR